MKGNVTKSIGASGVGYPYLKKLASEDSFLNTLAKTFTTILNSPGKLIEIPELYEYKSVQFYKNSVDNQKGIREISVTESILHVFHKIILIKFMKNVKIRDS